MLLFFLCLTLLPTACWYLSSSAVITRWLWSRYPAWLDKLMYCAACSGFWWGLLISLAFSAVKLHPYPWYTAPIWGLIVLVTNPLVGALHKMALDRLGHAEEAEEAAPAAPPLTFADQQSALQGLISRPVL